MRQHDIQLLNAVTEPVSIREVAQEAFGRSFDNQTEAPPVAYDVRTRHAALFKGEGDYLESRATALRGLKRFVDSFYS